MTDDGVREIWSDRELDIALSTLRSEVDTDTARMASARAELLTAAGAAEPAPADDVPVVEPVVEPVVRRRSWWVASAAAVVLVVAVVLVAQLVRGAETPPGANPVELLEQAAANASDEPVGPGQYRFIPRHMWSVLPTIDGEEMLNARRSEEWSRVWIPRNWREDWMRTGACVRAFTLPDGTPNTMMCDHTPYEIVTPCGADESEIATWCDRPGTWGSPNQTFYDSMTRDPDTMRDQMIAEYDANLRDFFPDGIPDGEHVSPEEKVMRLASGLLKNGDAPADVRATVYRLIASLPGLRVTDPDASVDGRRGVAFGFDFDPVRWELIIEPSTGEFIGECEVYLRTDRLIPAGTEASYSVSTTVVDGIGQQPS